MRPTDTNKLRWRLVRADSPFFASIAASKGGSRRFSPPMYASFFPLAHLIGSALTAGLLLHSPLAHAQMTIPAAGAAARGYDFLTVTTIESGLEREAKVLLSPAFEEQSEIPLANASLYSLSKDDFQKLSRNTVTINQLLSRVTVAGWELFQVYSLAPPHGATATPPVTRYLFRKAKN